MTVKAIPDTPSDLVAKLLQEYNKGQADITALRGVVAALVTLANELKADHNAHLGAASMHYNGTAGVTDAVNTTAAAAAGAPAAITAEQVEKLV